MKSPPPIRTTKTRHSSACGFAPPAPPYQLLTFHIGIVYPLREKFNKAHDFVQKNNKILTTEKSSEMCRFSGPLKSADCPNMLLH